MMSVCSSVMLAFTRRFCSSSFWVLHKLGVSLLAFSPYPEIELPYFSQHQQHLGEEGVVLAYISVDYTALLKNVGFIIVVHLEFGK